MESAKWYFGNHAGLDFSSGTPVAIVDGKINHQEACAVVCEANGSLLFYTDGMNVWNKNHVIMPGGWGLKGDSSSSQTIIVPHPGNNYQYYIFTCDAEAKADGLNYSIVDVTMNGGIGDVILKNSNLLPRASEKIVAIKHCNNKDVWIVAHEWNSDKFVSYLLTSSGLITSPVYSAAGIVHNSASMCIGYMKASPVGNKLAVSTMGNQQFQLFDFDNSSGLISSAVTFNIASYGLEFSQSGTKLYAGAGIPALYQIDLSAGTPAAILASVTPVGSVTGSYIAALQLGIDGKIYVARPGLTTLGVINSPDVAGVACNFIDKSIDLLGKSCQEGLPPLIIKITNSPLPSLSSKNNCVGDSIFFSLSTTPQADSMKWDFGDPLSGSDNSSSILSPAHVYSQYQTYQVKLILYTSCTTDTIQLPVQILPCFLTVSKNHNDESCKGIKDGKAWVTPVGGKPPYKFLWNTIPPQVTDTAFNIQGGTYQVTVTDSNGVSVIETITVNTGVGPNADAGSNKYIKKGEVVHLNGSGGNLYQWSPPIYLSNPIIKDPEASPDSTISYTLVVTNAVGCKDSDEVIIYVMDENNGCDIQYYFPSAFSPNADGMNDTYRFYITNVDCIVNFSIKIFDRWGDCVFFSTDPLFEWSVKDFPVETDSAVLTYVCKFSDQTGNDVIKTGNITLIK